MRERDVTEAKSGKLPGLHVSLLSRAAQLRLVQA